MGFETIQTTPRLSRNITTNRDGVAVGIYVRKKEPLRLTFFIGENVLTLMGLKVGDRVVVQEGSGADHGLFRIVPAGAAGGLTLTRRDGSKTAMPSIALDTSRTATLRNAPAVAAEVATFERFGSSLTVLVPWCHPPAAADSPRAKESLL